MENVYHETCNMDVQLTFHFSYIFVPATDMLLLAINHKYDLMVTIKMTILNIAFYPQWKRYSSSSSSCMAVLVQNFALHCLQWFMLFFIIFPVGFVRLPLSQTRAHTAAARHTQGARNILMHDSVLSWRVQPNTRLKEHNSSTCWIM